jgi:hypothetical protein
MRDWFALSWLIVNQITIAREWRYCLMDLRSSWADQVDITSQTATGIELDTGHGGLNRQIGRDYPKRTTADDSLPEEIEPRVEQLSNAAALLVPIEVVCPTSVRPAECPGTDGGRAA